MNEAIPIKSYDTVTIEVKLKRPTWGSYLSGDMLEMRLEEDIQEVIHYLSHHPNVGIFSEITNEWQCGVCKRHWSTGQWRENKRNASMCCYEGEE